MRLAPFAFDETFPFEFLVESLSSSLNAWQKCRNASTAQAFKILHVYHKLFRSKPMRKALNAFANWMVKSGEASSKCYYNNKRAYYI
tara:strand:- start:80 stop:340 length:261 start_codon:yes stop_codon:yes gene_type:complete